MSEHISDLSDHERRNSRDQAVEHSDPGEGDEPVKEEHLLMMQLLYSPKAGKNGNAGPGHRESGASLDTLREASGLPAWQVWELVDDLQEWDLVNCIWDSRPLRAQSSTQVSGETSGDLRFLHCTQAELTDKGLSYPPLLEYHRQRRHRLWEKPAPAADLTHQRQAPPRRPRYSKHRPKIMQQPSRAYHIYKPREQAARRLAYLSVVLCVMILAAIALMVLALT